MMIAYVSMGMPGFSITVFLAFEYLSTVSSYDRERMALG